MTEKTTNDTRDGVWSAAEEQLDNALCNFCNEVNDPFEPVSEWNEGVRDAFHNLCKAYNAWCSWKVC